VGLPLSTALELSPDNIEMKYLPNN